MPSEGRGIGHTPLRKNSAYFCDLTTSSDVTTRPNESELSMALAAPSALRDKYFDGFTGDPKIPEPSSSRARVISPSPSFFSFFIFFSLRESTEREYFFSCFFLFLVPLAGQKSHKSNQILQIF